MEADTMIVTPKRAATQAIKDALVGISRNHNQANAIASRGELAKIRATLATVVSLNEVKKAAVPEAPMMAAARPGPPILTKSLARVPRQAIYAVVNKAAKRPRQKITSHALASTPFVKIPAELKTIADMTTRVTPMK